MVNEEMYTKTLKMIEDEIDGVYDLIDDCDSYQKWGVDAWQTLAGIKGMLAVLKELTDKGGKDCNKCVSDAEIKKRSKEYENNKTKIRDAIITYNFGLEHDDCKRIDKCITRDGEYIYEFVK